MEAFADSEEEYHMPVDEGDAKEEKTKKNDKKQKPKKSYERFSSEEEEDDNDEEEKLVMNFRRNKFRSDEEIDALLSLYNENTIEEDDSEGDAIINMTAADFFGRPNSKYLESRKRTEDKQRYTSTQRGNEENSVFDDDDDGSWGEQKDDNEDHEWNNSRNGFDSEDAANDYDSSADEEKPLGDSKKIIKKGEKDQQTAKKVKLEEQTKQLESELLAEKPWAMRGETSATARPLNSLLEATPQFEVSSKVAPIVTQEHSVSIEAVIKQRILAEDWDVSSAPLTSISHLSPQLI
jgi:U3 small nucleolar RNA-associated protein MPP10